MLQNWTQAQRNILRLAVAVTVSVLFAFIVGWPGSFIMPVLVCTILSGGGPAMPFGKGVGLVVAVALLLLTGQLVTEMFLAHPAVCLVLVVWLLLLGQYAAIRDANALLIVNLFIAILALPLLGMDSMELVDVFVGALIFSVTMTVLICWLAHGIVYDADLEAGEKPAAPVPDKSESFRQALIKTLLVVPLLLAFFFFQLTSDLLVLVFVALLIQMPSAAIGIKGAIATLAANALGGLAAVVCYQALVMAPSPVMLGLVVFGVSLLFGQKIFSGAPTASLYGTGLNTVIVLLGATTSSFGDEAAADMWVRLFQISTACLYIVAALSLAANWLQPKSEEPGAENSAAPAAA